MTEEKYKYQLSLEKVFTSLGEGAPDKKSGDYSFHKNGQKNNIDVDISRRGLRIKGHIYHVFKEKNVQEAEKAAKFLEKTITDKILHDNIRVHYVQRIIQRNHEVLSAKIIKLSQEILLLGAPRKLDNYLFPDTGTIISTQSLFPIMDPSQFDKTGLPKVVGYINAPISSMSLLTPKGYKTAIIQTNSELIRQICETEEPPADIITWLNGFADFHSGEFVYTFSDSDAAAALEELAKIADLAVKKTMDYISTIEQCLNKRSLGAEDITILLQKVLAELKKVDRLSIKAAKLGEQVKGGERIIIEDFQKLNATFLSEVRSLCTKKISEISIIYPDIMRVSEFLTNPAGMPTSHVQDIKKAPDNKQQSQHSSVAALTKGIEGSLHVEQKTSQTKRRSSFPNITTALPPSLPLSSSPVPTSRLPKALRSDLTSAFWSPTPFLLAAQPKNGINAPLPPLPQGNSISSSLNQ